MQYPEIPLKTIAKTLSIAKSTLGYHLKLPHKDELLAKKIKEVHETNPYYGYRRIAMDLCIHEKRVRRVMKLVHIQAF
jgi:HTH-like domain